MTLTDTTDLDTLAGRVPKTKRRSPSGGSSGVTVPVSRSSGSPSLRIPITTSFACAFT